MEQSHAPSTCEGWQSWLNVIKEILPKLPKEGKFLIWWKFQKNLTSSKSSTHYLNDTIRFDMSDCCKCYLDLKECPETERVANSLWLITNSKSCPKCSSPIQKNEGCNHIKCTKVRAWWNTIVSDKFKPGYFDF
jgi:hypothetical protein